MDSYQIETPFGPAQLTPTGSDHRHVNVRFGYNRDGEPGLTINRVEYEGRADFADYGDGMELYPDERGDTYNAIRADRSDWKHSSYYSNQITPAAKKKLATALTQIVREWAEANASKFDTARLEDLKLKASWVRRDIDEKRDELATLEADLAEIVKEIG